MRDCGLQCASYPDGFTVSASHNEFRSGLLIDAASRL